jgi:hypothetical protein
VIPWPAQHRHCSRNLRLGSVSNAIAIIRARRRKVSIGAAKIVRFHSSMRVDISLKERRRPDESSTGLGSKVLAIWPVRLDYPPLSLNPTKSR